MPETRSAAKRRCILEGPIIPPIHLSTDAIGHILDYLDLVSLLRLAGCNSVLRKYTYKDNGRIWKVIDFGSKECIISGASKFIVDYQLRALLHNCRAREHCQVLKLTGCIQISGNGLDPLRGSSMLREIDLRLNDSVRFSAVEIDTKSVLSVLSSMPPIAQEGTVPKGSFGLSLVKFGRQSPSDVYYDQFDATIGIWLRQFHGALQKQALEKQVCCGYYNCAVEPSNDTEKIESTHCEWCQKFFTCTSRDCQFTTKSYNCDDCGKIECEDCFTGTFCRSDSCGKALCLGCSFFDCAKCGKYECEECFDGIICDNFDCENTPICAECDASTMVLYCDRCGDVECKNCFSGIICNCKGDDCYKTLCGSCEEIENIWYCDKCEKVECEDCFNGFICHGRGCLKLLCEECEEMENVLYCANCNNVECSDCFHGYFCEGDSCNKTICEECDDMQENTFICEKCGKMECTDCFDGCICQVNDCCNTLCRMCEEMENTFFCDSCDKVECQDCYNGTICANNDCSKIVTFCAKCEEMINL